MYPSENARDPKTKPRNGSFFPQIFDLGIIPTVCGRKAPLRGLVFGSRAFELSYSTLFKKIEKIENFENFENLRISKNQIFENQDFRRKKSDFNLGFEFAYWAGPRNLRR